MYLLRIEKTNNTPALWILILPFEQKDFARQWGFSWNTFIQSAWATDDQRNAVKAIVQTPAGGLTIDPDTLEYIKLNSKMTEETYTRFKEGYTQPDRQTRAGIAAAKMTDTQVLAIHSALRDIAAVCDGTATEDFAGFNRNDTEYGHALAQKSQLTRKDAGFAHLMLFKYRRQLDMDLFRIIYPEEYKVEANAAFLKAQKASNKLHTKGKQCEWELCEPCKELTAKNAPAEVSTEVAQTPVRTVTSSPYTLPVPLDINEANARVDGVLRIRESVQKNAVLIITGSEPLGYTDAAGVPHLNPGAEKRIVKMTLSDDQQDSDPEVIRLATSLIDCHPSQFDATVDLLRELRKIDAPKEAKSKVVKDMWAAQGFPTT